MLNEFLFEENTVDMDVYPVSGTKLLWRAENTSNLDCEYDDAELLSKCSLVNRTSFFKDLSKVSTQEITGKAERYGGRGIGINGGGGRVINIDSFQLKGIGANCLVGADAPASHSYGGLEAQGAFKEIVYSLLINRISPIGAQRVYALILLDRKSATYKDSTWATILVREPCPRPGHFVRAPDFKMKAEFLDVIDKDELRIKKIYQKIGREHSSTKFVQQIYEFLDKSASQLAFCRIARFAHGVLSESNMAFDGRLLDTSLCGFVYGGVNTCQVSDFYSEAQYPLAAAEEMVHMLNKYNYLTLDIEPLKQYYFDKFQEHLLINAGYIFALEHGRSLQLTAHPAWQKSVFFLNSVIISGKGEKSYVFPSLAYNDQVSDILAIALFAKLHNKKPTAAHADHLKEFIGDFGVVLDEIYTMQEEDFSSHESFLISISIQILKRAFLASFFYLTYISKLSEDVVESGLTSNVNNVIGAIQYTIDWIFEDVNAKTVTLFRSKNIRVTYEQNVNEFQIFNTDEIMFNTNNAKELFIYLLKSDINYKVLHYNFKPFLLQITSLLFASSHTSFKGVKDVYI